MNNAGKIVTYGVRGISSLSKVIPWIVIWGVSWKLKRLFQLILIQKKLMY
jgi:hypothetical protein